jgi:hypothetical protein
MHAIVIQVSLNFVTQLHSQVFHLAKQHFLAKLNAIVLHQIWLIPVESMFLILTASIQQAQMLDTSPILMRHIQQILSV